MFGRVLPELSEIIIQIGESFLKNQFAANGIYAQPRGSVFIHLSECKDTKKNRDMLLIDFEGVKMGNNCILYVTTLNISL